LFHKYPFVQCAEFLMIRNIIRNICIISMGMLWAAIICPAQTAPSKQTEKQQKEDKSSDKNESDAQQIIFMPIDSRQLDNRQIEKQQPPAGEEKDAVKEEPKAPSIETNPATIVGREPTGSLGVRSFVGDVVHSARNQFGFSLNAYQGYTTDITGYSQANQSNNISAVMPRVFFNIGKRKSVLHLDLGGEYTHNYVSSNSDAWDYSARAYYSYQLISTKRTSVQIADQFASLSNGNAWSFFSPFSNYMQIHSSSDFSNAVVLDQKRTILNSLTATYSYRLCRKCSMGVFGAFDVYRYSRKELQGNDAFNVGAFFDYRLNKWLDLSNSYSVNLNHANDGFSQTRIHELKFSGLNFHLGRSWRAWIGGGASMLGNQNNSFEHSTPGINGGIGYYSVNPAFSITHTRGYSWAEGISRILKTSTTAANFGYRFSRRVNAGLQAYYNQGRELSGDGQINTIAGGGSLEFALRRDLSLSLNSYYENQRAHNFSVQGLNLSRLSAYLGLQYVWPSRR
jgi:hypothetical protein